MNEDSISEATTTSNKKRLSGLALAALLLGLAAPFTLVTGPLALYFGYRGLYAVNASGGRVLGRGAAVLGMILGGLVTIAAVIGLIALSLTKMRSVSELTECQNNLRVVGLAVNLFEESHAKVFPRAIVPLADQPPDKHASWMAAMLPYLNAKPNTKSKWELLYGRLDLEKPWDDSVNELAVKSFVPFYHCPADPHYDPIHNPSVTKYVGVAGIGQNAAWLPRGSACAGFFGYDRQLTLDDLKSVGTSHKMMILETDQNNGPWIAGGFSTARGVGFDPTFLTEQGATIVGLAAAFHSTSIVLALEMPRPEEVSLIGPGRPFGGLHRGGLNVLWVDGSVRFVSETIPPRLFRIQATLADDITSLAKLP